MFNPKTGRLFCQTYTGKDGGGGGSLNTPKNFETANN